MKTCTFCRTKYNMKKETLNKTTLSIGIPAYNEAGNIINILTALYSQSSEYYVLEKIIIIPDGCTDNTEDLVREFAKTHKEVDLYSDGKRVGKAARLNEIYKETTSDFLLSIDADVLPKSPNYIDLLVKGLIDNPKTNVTCGRFIPVKHSNLWGSLSNYSYYTFEDAILKLNNGNNIYALMGAAHMVRMSFGKTLHFPKGTISDQNRLYVLATQNNPHGFLLVKNAEIYMRTVSTFYDWRVLGVRSTSTDKENLVRFFGPDVMKIYYMPRKLLIPSLFKYFFKNPILTTGSVVMNIYIRKFPYKVSTPKNGIWETTTSSKTGTFVK